MTEFEILSREHIALKEELANVKKLCEEKDLEILYLKDRIKTKERINRSLRGY